MTVALLGGRRVRAEILVFGAHQTHIGAQHGANDKMAGGDGAFCRWFSHGRDLPERFEVWIRDYTLFILTFRPLRGLVCERAHAAVTIILN